MQKFYKDGMKILEVMYKERLFSDSAIFKTLEEIGELAKLKTADTDAAVDYLTSSDYIQRDALGSNPNLTLTNYGLVHIENYLNIGGEQLKQQLPEDLENTEVNPRNVFVVYGRNLEIKKSMFTFLRSIDLHPIEWSEARKKTNKTNPYIGEILDLAFSEAKAIVVILDPEDVVFLHPNYQKKQDKKDEKEPRLQPRPNVLFEAGFAMGRDENRTIIVEIGQPKTFSDLDGRHVVRLSNDFPTRQELASRLETAGCEVNLNGTDWHDVGDFEIEKLTLANILNPSDEKISVSEMFEEEIDLLKIFAAQSVNDSQIYSFLDCSNEKIDYCIDRLIERNFIVKKQSFISAANNILTPLEITSLGRKYLFESGILE